MIQIEEVTIKEFRGIRNMTLKLNSASYLVWGPNGSGKSGVVDALDFILTGKINRLSGTGSGDLSVARHGPHVLSQSNPAASSVSAVVKDPVSGKTAVLTRTLNKASAFTLEPEISEVRAAVLKAQDHPEFALSRSDIMKYIIAKPADRAEQVQSLLKLDRMSAIRKLLKTVENKAKTNRVTADNNHKAAETSFYRHLEVPDKNPTRVLSALNDQRSILGLANLAEISPNTVLNEGVDVTSGTTPFDKSSALRDVKAAEDWLSNTTSFKTSTDQLGQVLVDMENDQTVFTALKQRDLILNGLEQVSDNSCPLCDAEWASQDELVRHLTQKIENSDKAEELRKNVTASSQAVVGKVSQLRGLLKVLEGLAGSHGPQGFRNSIEAWRDDLMTFSGALSSPQAAILQIDRVQGEALSMPNDFIKSLTALRDSVEQEPDLSAAHNARMFLVLAEERWKNLIATSKIQIKKVRAFQEATIAYSTYCEVADSALTTLYKDVENDLNEYYRFINSDDEAQWEAEFKPSEGKLDLTVDFYGRGKFPPNAYHSEGHQDGMGVCLYLALAKRVLGNDFRFAVLDDVVMSIDSSHRKQFCELLKEKFPDIQFVITTHDEIWARQMQTSGLVGRKNQARFFGWTVDGGPRHELGREFWEKIEEYLSQNQISDAAATLRWNIEASLNELVTVLQGTVVFRPAANYGLDELLSSVKAQHGKLLRKAAKAANSYSKSDLAAEIEKLKVDLTVKGQNQTIEQWAINPSVHFNQWASFSVADFRPVVDAWKQMLSMYECEELECSGWIYLLQNNMKDDSLRCKCGTYNLNLRAKGD